MAILNPSFEKLQRRYIFSEIEEKLSQIREGVPLLNFGIGDIALPLAPSIAKAIASGVEEMTSQIRGYGPSEGYAFLREAICSHELASVGITPDEIFISDGANSDVVNILDLFCPSARIGIVNPAYPAYLDASLLRGHQHIVELPCIEENHFIPQLPKEDCQLIYLCSPHNPTGIALTHADLQRWIDYAQERGAILLLDSAYEAFISSPHVPRNIFSLKGAKECVIEFRSFSKSAGFTGLRCAYTILPKTVKAKLGTEWVSLHPFWKRRQAVKFNGVAYPVQKGAEAVYSEQGQRETQAQVRLYLDLAHQLKTALQQLGWTCYGGIDAPYLWVKAPASLSSWECFDLLLERYRILTIPGSGFGSRGEGFVRFSTFTTPEQVNLALERFHGS